MQKAENILEAIRKMGEKQVPLTRVYRSLFSEDLFLAAYAKIYRNNGALTPGTEPDTADGMSIARIRHIIEQLRYERYRFHPVRRVFISKKSGGKRPLGMPNFSDKLVQEALRLILEAYYEPRFRDSSHGFRSGRGCHTALEHVKVAFKGTAWFIEGDITGCFDNIDHDILMDILRRDIQDGRLLNLIQQCLKAGALEDWKYLPSFSGVPQGGILSPLLSNIYLHELDTFIEETLIPQYTKGTRRANNPDYALLTRQIEHARRTGNKAQEHELVQQRRSLPSQDIQDPNYRRLKYVRYADDFLLGFIGSKSEAESIKAALGEFVRNKLHLQASDEKSLITHARTQYARFLGYAISTYKADGKLTRSSHDNAKRRSVNGGIRLGIPYGLIDETAKRYQRGGKPVHESVLIDNSDAHIIMAYQNRFRGLAEYYKYAVDRHKLSKLGHVMEVSLAKTLARKHKTSVSKIYRRYKGTRTVDGRRYKTLQVEVETKTGTTTIYWGAIPLRTVQAGKEPLEDTRYREQWRYKRSDLIQRLQADTCELCGSQVNIQVHHVRKLSDLKKRWAGRKAKPEWVKHMIAARRKTLMVCHQCHVNIHAGKPVSQTRI
jgi:group II intron reverse transcriptase/maturase